MMNEEYEQEKQENFFIFALPAEKIIRIDMKVGPKIKLLCFFLDFFRPSFRETTENSVCSPHRVSLIYS
jgi:hypothetical protein